uniref:Uncharacterized protein n=1 Tax=Periophthalmus magnuspinnatus TaxID=409849 RepID=A0A3B3ZID3_9GOBI
MPAETLPASARRPVGTVVTSTPPRLRPKAPVAPELYRRRQGGPKQSAVERLEADKAKYVKSQVALSKQQPVRPLEVSRAVLSCSTKPPVTAKSKESLQLDLEHLSNLISDVSDGPRADDTKPPQTVSPQKKPTPPSPAPPAAGTVRRVDVLPQAGSAPVLPPPSPAFTRLSSSSGRKRPSLTRSKSDLSDRVSRAGTELERFFNLCGLDPADFRDLTASNSDIVSLARFRSVSAPGSECGGSGREEEEEEEEENAGNAAARVPYGVSVIERNARVIKWLYGLGQAKDNANTSTNL